MKYRVEVIADNSGQWVGNQLTFETEAEAKVYAFDLMMRWTLVRDTRVVEVDECDPGDRRGAFRND